MTFTFLCLPSAGKLKLAHLQICPMYLGRTSATSVHDGTYHQLNLSQMFYWFTYEENNNIIPKHLDTKEKNDIFEPQGKTSKSENDKQEQQIKLDYLHHSMFQPLLH